MIMFSLQTQDAFQREFKARVAFATALRLFFPQHVSAALLTQETAGSAERVRFRVLSSPRLRHCAGAPIVT